MPRTRALLIALLLLATSNCDIISYRDTLYVAPGGDTGGMYPAYASIQDAVAAAVPGDVIKVAAGSYTDTSTRNGLTQALYVNNDVSITGGYSISDWSTSAPDVHTTSISPASTGTRTQPRWPSAPSRSWPPGSLPATPT